MAGLCRLGFKYLTKNVICPAIIQRNLSISTVNHLKEIQTTKIGKEIIVEGVTVESPRAALLVKPEIEVDQKKHCYMCALDLDLKHTDVLILSQFVRTDGCMLPRRITGLCRRQQIKVGKMVTMAQKAGLMINLTPENCNKDPKRRYRSKKFNTYFDESTIFQWKIPKITDRFKRNHIYK